MDRTPQSGVQHAVLVTYVMHRLRHALSRQWSRYRTQAGMNNYVSGSFDSCAAHCSRIFCCATCRTVIGLAGSDIASGKNESAYYLCATRSEKDANVCVDWT
eukprot:3787259-Pleurochrysis_carterae.AAC.3